MKLTIAHSKCKFSGKNTFDALISNEANVFESGALFCKTPFQAIIKSFRHYFRDNGILPKISKINNKLN